MNEDDIRDPRVAPRWLEVGITGVPRVREWDAVATVDVPELEGASVSELAFTILRDGTPALPQGVSAPAEVIARLGRAVDDVERPSEVLAVRRGVRDWSVAARRLDADVVALPSTPAVAELAVAIGPDGGRTVLADGEDASGDPAFAAAADELERLGRERHTAFVARASRTAAGWTLTVDPL